ncbi:hypothetical protein GCM10017783_08960 [Deinococcus piscis]|uniref:DUF985 domain-containing protein n=1 Tax=Deinococcus piscis TaxID=394230 RepID=A0ABQ3K2J5_9DEIO|nr:hypothetical protein [Deinococcus piscis]GHF99115.1 hypothetical protein GCM10017783_08960 [Deinococcus piscis]
MPSPFLLFPDGPGRLSPVETDTLPPTALNGTWFVTRTSLPLWRALDNPSITYAPLPGGQVSDTVRATRRGRERLICGLDTPLSTPGAFEWRGVTPLTRLAPSRWEVLACDPAGARWLVTLFAATPFTPAGLDFCTREPWLLPDDELALHRALAGVERAAPYLPRLFAPRHDAAR